MYTLTDYFNDEGKHSLNVTSQFLCELCEGRIFVFRHDNKDYYTFIQRNFDDFFVYFLQVRKTTREEFLKSHSKYVDADDGEIFRIKLTEDFFDEKIFGESPEKILPGMEIIDLYD